MIKSIIFDWNGVIVDDLDVWARASQEICAEYFGISITTDQWTNHPCQDWIERYRLLGVDEAGVQKVLANVHSFYLKHCEAAKIQPDTKDALGALNRRGMKLGVYSSNLKNSILHNIRQFALEDIFSFIVSADDVKYQKPHPEGLLKAIDHTGRPARETIYIDDMAQALEVAKQIGLRTIGFESVLAQDFRHADYSARNLTQVLEIVEQVDDF